MIYRVKLLRVFISHPPHSPDGTKQNEPSNASREILVNDGNTTLNYANKKYYIQHVPDQMIQP